MDLSFLYIKRFLDNQIKVLNSPLVVENKIKDLIEDSDEKIYNSKKKQVQFAIHKTNTLIKRHNRNMYRAPIVDQVVEQIIKCEQRNLLIVNERLLKAQRILQPFNVPDSVGLSARRLQESSQIVEEMPASKYLLLDMNSSDSTEDEDENAYANDSSDTEAVDRLIGDAQEKTEMEVSNKRFKSHLGEKVHELSVGSDQKALLVAYDQVLSKLRHSLGELRRKHSKLIYLKNIEHRLKDSLGSREDNAYRDYDSPDEPFDSDDDMSSTSSPNPESNSEQLVFEQELNRFVSLVEAVEKNQ